MIKKIMILLFLLVGSPAWATTCNTPSSTYTYTSGQVINPSQVQTNENNLYTYDQQGVCNYLAGSITQSAISSTAGILYSQLNLSNSILGSDIATNANVSIGTLAVTSNITTMGDVGIGTATPTGSLIVETGNVGIGTNSPPVVLDVIGTISATSFSGQSGTGLLKTSTTPSFGSIYHASTDGTLAGYSAGSPDIISCITDSSSTPSTIVTSSSNASAGQNVACSAQVLKGNYYEITTGGTGTASSFTPLGS